MKYYVVFNSERNFCGYTTKKEDVRRFKEQREMDQFHIMEINETDPDSQKLIQILKGSPEHMVYQYGFVMFPSEEEYFYLSFDQMIMDLYQKLANIIKECIPYVKYEKEEEKILNDFLYKIFQHMEDYEESLSDGMDDIEITDRFFKVEAMVRHIIRSFGGK